MTSELFYANLQTGDWDARDHKAEVETNLKDYISYLVQTKKALERQKFDFTFAIQKKKLKIVIPDDLDEHHFDIKQFYWDSTGRKAITVLSIDELKKELEISGQVPFDSAVFYRKKDEPVLRRFIFSTEIVLGEIIPNVKTDEEAKEALDFIFERSESVFNSESSQHFFARILRTDRGNGTISINKDPTATSLKVGADVSNIKKQIQALYHLSNKPYPHHEPLLKLLVNIGPGEWNIDEELEEFTPRYLERKYDGYDSQEEFIKKALRTKDIAILEGPPGSGKTASLIELIAQCIARDETVLMVASTHVAVDNILERISEDGVGERIMDKFGIVPLRIGREDAVSERISQFCINRVCAEKKESMKKSLSQIKDRKPYQQMLYDALCASENEKTLQIEDMVLDMANFVCGTTLGILQAPMIRNNRDPLPYFDVLILDEASKTTFQEFLVPALYARKWILSGDPKQLAPYVEEESISECLNGFAESEGFTREDRDICLDVMLSQSRSVGNHKENIEFCQVIVCEDGSDQIRKYDEQIKTSELCIEQWAAVFNKVPHEMGAVVITGEIDESVIRKIMVASLIVTDRSTINRLTPYLCPLTTIKGAKEMDRLFVRRCRAWKRDADPYRVIERNLSWEQEVTWRLGRIYEIREDRDKWARYDLEIELLLPRFELPGDRNKYGSAEKRMRDTVRRIRNVALPSILDLLMFGLDSEKDKGPEGVALLSGLPTEARALRSALLSHQYRMHPEISAFPRSNIYHDEALFDGSEMADERKRGIRRYGRRAMVIDSIPKQNEIESKRNVNLREVKNMMTELDHVMKWAASESKSKGEPWSIAMLTFYKGQEDEIAAAFKEKYHRKGYRVFRMPEKNVEVEICSVDRFQGHEADIVFLSFVRSRAHDRGIGFLDNRNRLNVAITRARYQMLVFADVGYLKNSRTPLIREFMEQLGKDIVFRDEDQ